MKWNFINIGYSLRLKLTHTKYIYILILMTMKTTRNKKEKEKERKRVRERNKGGEWKKIFIHWRNIARITIRNYDNTFFTTTTHFSLTFLFSLTLSLILLSDTYKSIFRSYKGWLFLSNFMTMVYSKKKEEKKMRKILPHKLFEKVVLFHSITNVRV